MCSNIENWEYEMKYENMKWPQAQAHLGYAAGQWSQTHQLHTSPPVNGSI